MLKTSIPIAVFAAMALTAIVLTDFLNDVGFGLQIVVAIGIGAVVGLIYGLTVRLVRGRRTQQS